EPVARPLRSRDREPQENPPNASPEGEREDRRNVERRRRIERVGRARRRARGVKNRQQPLMKDQGREEPRQKSLEPDHFSAPTSLDRFYPDVSFRSMKLETFALERWMTAWETKTPFDVLLGSADHVVAVYPAYQQLYSVPRAIGCDVSLWKLRREDGFRYDVDDLERLVTPRTKLIVLNTPHNPTGAMLSEEDLRRI